MNQPDSMDTEVRLAVYRYFVERGRAPVPFEIAETIGAEQSAVEDSLRHLAADHVLVLAPGTPYIWMANPLSAIPTSFSVEAAGRTWFGNCIWDSLGIVAMLGGTGRVQTRCPDCGEQLAVEVSENRLSAGTGVVHFAVPAAGWWDDIGFN
jgi:hypothetical protein